MTVRQCLVLLLVCSALGLGVPLLLGVTYSARLSSHDTGFFAVQVDDAIAATELPRRPRRSVLVVIDGLGHEAAKAMGAIALLREHGQCRKTAVGIPSMSRPVYATISTGLEQDRTGARGNDDEAPLFAQSAWDLARAAGLSVAGVSEVTWWQQLFPGGFTRFEVLPLEADYFAAVPPGDLQLVHPLYVDEAGHEFGSASREYADAVARADRELTGLLRTLDFAQDLVIVTADHGHSLRGGHGGAQEPIANVMTCHAGLGVRRDPEYGHLRITTVAPSLALLLGLPFPAHMRAGDDDLDVLWDIADPAVFPAAYLADRRAAVERFRRANEDAVRAWLPDSQGSWDAFYAAHRARHRSGARVLVAALALVCLLQLHLHRRREQQGEARSAALFGLGFVAMFGAVTYALQVGLRGSFDLSSVAGRGDFIGFTLTMGVCWTALAALVHWLLRRDRCALMLDLAAILLLGAVLAAAHPLVLGWRLGFPVPSPTVYFFPYFAALMFPAVAGVALVVAAVFGLRPLRRRSDMIART
ncbi:Type I phosphodiesterase / nucleotide pyrophosphatase [Nannocystis exedens]|uniref:Type I phosphodiesterase / nucleotide pyrophosphatase n=1 Tax=Nannocystis exedens TaxID=54 RepID=A0A1I2EYM6_9BACT|nr:alkaline phosphatase family protein [Nannocystis exedens]PCC69496.1 Type I phosphodiesterase / nucleotide pyrophosphatase [Nannocystis exedens]SFE97391.1 Type I phosphodiesterase / nucleotide pyrophosphatase [Nannocystis exedens]